MSFRETLSKVWSNIQYKLFPQLEDDIGELSSFHKDLITVLELVRIENFLPCTRFNLGRPTKSRVSMARACIAKIVLKITDNKQLIRSLKNDKQLRMICGWDSFRQIPSESTFSRAFNEFASFSLPERIHQALIKDVYKDQIIGHVIKDSMPIIAREKALQKGSAKDRKKLKDKRRRNEKLGKELSRREKQLQETDLNKMIQDLPMNCDKGMKRSAQGYTKIWKGYKMHTAIDDHCIPLAVILTSASTHDCEVAIPLATKANCVAKNFYDLMDAAYDLPEIKKHSLSLGHIPIIDECPQNTEQKTEKEAERNRKKLLSFMTAEDRRYKERLPKERFHALYKDHYGGAKILYRGHSKIFCHVMFGVLALTALTLMNIIQ